MRSHSSNYTNREGLKGEGEDLHGGLEGWIGIQWRADEIYARKICAAVVALILNLVNFW